VIKGLKLHETEMKIETETLERVRREAIKIDQEMTKVKDKLAQAEARKTKCQNGRSPAQMEKRKLLKEEQELIQLISQKVYHFLRIDIILFNITNTLFNIGKYSIGNSRNGQDIANSTDCFGN
jgi:hypothetical protein